MKPTWCGWAITRQSRAQIPCAPAACGGCPGGMDAGCQLRSDLLLHIVSQHGEDLLYKGVQLLLEEQSWVLGLHLEQHDYSCEVYVGYQNS